MSEKNDKKLRIDILEDVAEVEIGRTLSDQNYGNWRLFVRVSTRASNLDKTIDELRDYVMAKIKGWDDIEREGGYG